MEPNKTYIIQHKETKELFRARSGKTSWKAPGHAKNAFNNSMGWQGCCASEYGLTPIEENRYGSLRKRAPLFSEQSLWEVVELEHAASTKLEEAVLLLKECLGRCDHGLHVKIENFLKRLEGE